MQRGAGMIECCGQPLVREAMRRLVSVGVHMLYSTE